MPKFALTTKRFPTKIDCFWAQVNGDDEFLNLEWIGCITVLWGKVVYYLRDLRDVEDDMAIYEIKSERKFPIWRFTLSEDQQEEHIEEFFKLWKDMMEGRLDV